MREVIEGIKILSMKSEVSPEINSMLSHPQYLQVIIGILVKASTNAKKADSELQMAIMCDALWSLQNLSFIPGVCQRLVIEFKIQRVILTILIDHFIED